MAIFRRTPDDHPATNPSCPHCHDPAQQTARHLHFLGFYDEGKLAAHVRAQYGPTADLDGTIAAITGWVRQIRATYGDLVDDQGLRLGVAEAWQRSLRHHEEQTGRRNGDARSRQH